MFSPATWVNLGLLILFLLLGKPLWRFITQALDLKSRKIQDKLAEVDRLKKQAEQLLEDAQLKKKQALEQAEEILNHSQAEIERLQQELTEQLNAYRQLEEKRLEERLRYLEHQAAQELRQEAITLALQKTEEALRKNLTPQNHTTLIEQSLEKLDQELSLKIS